MRRRTRTPRDPDAVLAISERELTALTDDLDALHHDVGMPALRGAVDEWADHVRTSRRSFLLGAGAVAGGVVLAACSSGSASPTSSTGGHASPAARLTGDLAVAGLAASLENLGVAAYGDVLTAAQAGKLGTVPPAVATFVTTVKGQHAQHAQAWNSVITAAGHPAVTGPDPALTPMVDRQFAKVTDVTGAAKLALELENVAAATYQKAVTAVKATSAVKVAASIQPVEMQHAAILHFALGQYPVPDAFAPTAQARPVSDLSA